jgi:ABC-type uncharacterized transport system ATPase subunit
MMKVELRDIRKYFGPVQANDGISLTIEAGTIQGLLGENGAGKSTLMKVLSGFIAPDSGEILIDGQPVEFASPAEAIGHGIGMLYQDPLDVPSMTVLDNFLLGREGGLFPNYTLARRELANLGQRFDFHLDLDARVSELTVGERQQIEILRLLWLGAEVLIFDEPTTGISAPQKVKLFAALRALAEQGKTIIFVSHKLAEVEELCHKVTVLRHGKVTGEKTVPCSIEELVRLMFGQVIVASGRREVVLGEPVLELENVTFDEPRLHIAGVSLLVRTGEIVGLAGLEGSGQQAFLQTCAGLLQPTAGTIRIGRRDLTGSPYRRFLDSGVAYMPASRLEEGLIAGLDLAEHFVLAGEQTGFFIDWDKALANAQKHIKEFSIVGYPKTFVEDLSGGNQQRALLALLPPNLKLLLMEHPTRGLDVESALWVWGRLLERCQEGTAILFTSSDLDEIMDYSDRILVFFGGEVLKVLDAKQTSVEHLGELIGGKGL